MLRAGDFMSIDQRIIQGKIDDKIQLIQCCISKKIRTDNGYFVGFHFIEPYQNISHTYSTEICDEIRDYMSERRKYDIR